jgi:hypothetical protein
MGRGGLRKAESGKQKAEKKRKRFSRRGAEARRGEEEEKF